MSYSYITKVFPNFQYSNVYDANLYNNISGLNKKPENIDNIKFDPLNEAKQYQEINKKYVEPMDIKLETYKNIENTEYGQLSKGTHFLSQNNETYYNKPLPLNLVNSTIDNSTLINKTELQKLYSSEIPTNYKELNSHKESFSQSGHESDSSNSSNDLHYTHTKHILECTECKEILLKQFNIETERIRNEQILELIVFLIFGLFILLLLDGLKK